MESDERRVGHKSIQKTERKIFVYWFRFVYWAMDQQDRKYNLQHCRTQNVT